VRFDFRSAALAIAGFGCLIGAEGIAMAEQTDSQKVEPVTLPAHWSGLKNSQKFEVVYGSSHLIGGRELRSAEIDCRGRSVKNPAAGSSLSFNYPMRETGSFSFKLASDDATVSGPLEVLTSDLHLDQRILVLIRPAVFHDGRYAVRTLGRHELASVADLFQTYHDRCGETRGRVLETYVIVAKQER
jgi:hypothetical protein